METKTLTFRKITEELNRTYQAKNADYGDSFGKSIREFGYVAGLVRISDKFNRAKNLLESKEQQVKTESVKDTLLDMAAYCIMLAMEVGNEDSKG
jgi:hypothetical protein